MRRLQGIAGIVVFLLLSALFLPAAGADSFAQDLAAIDKAAGSVLMLNVYDERNTLFATGSGFVVFDNKTLVTNYHVIRDAEWILAVSDLGYQYLVTKVIAADEKRDIALLEFYSPTDLTPLVLSFGQERKRAAPVVDIGSPQGVKNTVSLGNISAVYKEEDVQYIQFTAPISHGSSGGALFDDAGQVIGITSMYYYDSQNMNLAVDIDEVVRLKNAGFRNERVTFAGQRQRSRLPATMTPMPLPTPSPTPVPTPSPSPTPAPTLSPVPKANTELQLMSTYDGVILRWEKTPNALYYEIFRGMEDGEDQYIGSVPAEATYYLDADSAVEEKRCRYTISAVLSAAPRQSVDTLPAYADPMFAKNAELTAPYALTVKMGEYAPVLSWMGMADTEDYIVYRSTNPQGPFLQIWRTDETSFADYGARPGNVYFYQVKTFVEKGISDPSAAARLQMPAMPARTPPPEGAEPKYALVIGDDGYIDEFQGYLCLLPSLRNDSAYRTITSFALTYFCWDKEKEIVLEKNTKETYYTQRFDVAVGPGEMIYPSYTWMYGFENAAYVHVAVTGITFSDGTTVDVPEGDRNFFYWSIE